MELFCSKGTVFSEEKWWEWLLNLVYRGERQAFLLSSLGSARSDKWFQSKISVEYEVSLPVVNVK